MSKCLLCNSVSKVLYEKLFDDRFGAPRKYGVLVCQQCGFGETFPKLVKSQLPQFYAKYYPLHSVQPEEVVRSVSKRGKFINWLMGNNNIAHQYIRPKSKVLDIGCASGVSLLEINNLGAVGFGVEPDPSCLKIANKLKLKIHQGYIQDNPFPNQQFNYITASQVLEHEKDPLEFLLAAKKKLRPKGQIILSFPNINSFYRKIWKKRWIHWHIPYHQNHFSYQSLQRLASQSGLKIRRVKTITPNLWTILQIKHLLSKIHYKQKNPAWETHQEKLAFVKLTFLQRLTGQLSSRVYISLRVLIFPINRLIDTLGQGESFVVFLEKDED